MSIVTKNMRMQRAEERKAINQKVLEAVGRRPCGPRILVEIADDSEKTEDGLQKKGNIILPESVTEKELADMAVVKVVAMGADAFYDYYDPPKIGDWIIIKRYVGGNFKGKDGKRYRCPMDTDFICITSDNEDVDFIG